MMAQFAKDGDDEDMTEKQLPMLNEDELMAMSKQQRE